MKDTTLKYQLYNDDCFNIFPHIENKSIDLILADLPYGTTACKWDTILPLDKLWEDYSRIIKKDGKIVLTAAQPFTSLLVSSNFKDFKYELIWEKPQGTNPLNAKVMPLKSHENILIFSKNKGTYNPQMETGAPYAGFSSEDKKIGEVYGSAKSKHNENFGTRYPKSILRFSQDRGGLHPTQKPVPLFEYLIKTFSNEGELILDNTMGSGTTGVACANSGRRFVGIEMDKIYFNTAKQRIETAYNNLESFIS